ncbi:hypothetical protein DOTSEDRAFT_71426 [Dothistroma septosporum NZE10]|uniref:Uncharacterized protein n=1 Tax=Dothistroma septosporum (strain NZE10 / CBS 128990) TaxID=675120 RepID=N1PQR4_DOTSN|nr:hypothetical protein DOTSEDRAFT_71426 [Dothistroma septosporum NZE10]
MKQALFASRTREASGYPSTLSIPSRIARSAKWSVFIRHFFCGACEEYVKAISRTYTPEGLASP